MSVPDCLHHFITGEEAEEILKNDGKDGSFLIRPSSSNPDDLSLSVRRKDEIIHIRIQNTKDYYDLYGGEQFATLQALVDYYTKGEGKDKLVEKNSRTISMRYPIHAPKHRDERWFHPNITSSEAEEKLKSINQEGMFLVRESVSNARDFVMSCLVKGQVIHVMTKKEKGKYSIGDGESFTSLISLIDFYRANPMTVKQGKSSQLKFHLLKPLIEGALQISKLDSKIAELEKEFSCSNERIKRNGFWEEFNHIQQADNKEEANVGRQVAGNSQENKKKNRYRNIVPYDETRVILKSVDPGIPGSDYINANHISVKDILPHIKKIYIATQGCLKSTVGDFWNMVWQEKVLLIVMITELVENQKNKCHMYWPKEEETLTLDLFSCPLTVKEESSDMKESYVIRIFTITHKNETRTLYHYQHFNWPDKCTPTDISGCIDFVLDVNAKAKEIRLSDNSMWLIHCSAGIGRTGCFILIDIIINHIKCKGLSATVNIPKLLLAMRTQRAGLVQTEKQYTFVYKAVQHYINRHIKETIKKSPDSLSAPHSETPNDNFKPPISNKPGLQDDTQIYVNLKSAPNH